MMIILYVQVVLICTCRASYFKNRMVLRKTLHKGQVLHAHVSVARVHKRQYWAYLNSTRCAHANTSAFTAVIPRTVWALRSS